MKKIAPILIEALNLHDENLRGSLEECYSDFICKMSQNSFTSKTVSDTGQFDRIMKEFKVCLRCSPDVPSLERTCSKFLSILCDLKGPPERVACSLEKDWISKIELQHPHLAFLRRTESGRPKSLPATSQNLVGLPPPTLNHSPFSDGHLCSSSDSYCVRPFSKIGPGEDPCSEESSKPISSDSSTDVSFSVQVETESHSSTDYKSPAFSRVNSSGQLSLASASDLWFQQSDSSQNLSNMLIASNSEQGDELKQCMQVSDQSKQVEPDTLRQFKKKVKNRERQTRRRHKAETDALKQQLEQKTQELAQHAQLNERIEEVDKKNKDLNREKQLFHAEKMKLKNEYDQLTERIEEVERKNRDLKQEKQQFHAEKMKLKKDQDQLTERTKELARQKKDFKQEKRKFNAEKFKFQSKHDELTKISEEFEKKSKDFNREKQELDAERVEFQEKLDQLEQDCFQLEQTSAEIQKSKQDLKTKKSCLILLLVLSISILLVAGILLYLTTFKFELLTEFTNSSPGSEVQANSFLSEMYFFKIHGMKKDD